jgi:hypothetical protein
MKQYTLISAMEHSEEANLGSEMRGSRATSSSVSDLAPAKRIP